jgi:hypothetical protein
MGKQLHICTHKDSCKRAGKCYHSKPHLAMLGDTPFPCIGKPCFLMTNAMCIPYKQEGTKKHAKT